MDNSATLPPQIKTSQLKKPLTQPCPVCNLPIGILSGSQDAICQNCGYKDPCCE